MKFKHKTILMAGLMSLVFSACKKDGTIDFSLKFTGQASIQSGVPVQLPFEIMTPPVSSNSKAELEGRNSELNLINFVRLSSLELAIVSPQDKTFSFLKDVYVYVGAGDLDEKLVAESRNIDNNSRVLSLSPSMENLKEYLKKESFYIRVRAVTDETLTQQVDMDVRTVFDVNAGLK